MYLSTRCAKRLAVAPAAIKLGAFSLQGFLRVLTLKYLSTRRSIVRPLRWNVNFDLQDILIVGIRHLYSVFIILRAFHVVSY